MKDEDPAAGDRSTFDKANQFESPFKNDDPATKRKITQPKGSQKLIPEIEKEKPELPCPTQP